MVVIFKAIHGHYQSVGKAVRVEPGYKPGRHTHTVVILVGTVHKGVLDAIDPLLDASGRAISLRARLANPELKLRPGMFVRVRLAFGGERQGLSVPEEALVPAGNDNFVFRVAEGKAQRVTVKLGQRRGATVEIAEGLKAGDEVVTAGQLKLRDGVPVKAVPAGGPPAAAKPEQK